MKKIKISLSAIALVFGVCAAFAFKSPTNNRSGTKDSNTWYQYSGGGQDNVTKFTQTDAPSCPTGTAALCAVMLPDHGNDNPSQADLDAIQTEITNDLSGQIGTDPNVKLKGN